MQANLLGLCVDGRHPRLPEMCCMRLVYWTMLRSAPAVWILGAGGPAVRSSWHMVSLFNSKMQWEKFVWILFHP